MMRPLSDFAAASAVPQSRGYAYCSAKNQSRGVRDFIGVSSSGRTASQVSIVGGETSDNTGATRDFGKLIGLLRNPALHRGGAQDPVMTCSLPAALAAR